MAVCHTSALVTPDELREIIDTDLIDARLCNFINMAYVMSLPLADKLDDCGGATMLEQIQLLLAAHFLSLYQPQTVQESIADEWTVRYALTVGLGLASSTYGQNAIALDCSGTLATQGMKKAQFKVTSYYQTKDSTKLFDEDLL